MTGMSDRGWHWYLTRRRLRLLPVWRIPLVMLVLALFLSWLLPFIDRHLVLGDGDVGGVLFVEIDDSAMSNLLSAIAGGMITLTGLVFTALTLAMQFGAAQLSVRIVPILRQDPVMRWSIGLFLATFVYTLLVSVRLAVREEDYRPLLSVLCAIGLSVCCAVLFLALVTRVTGVLNSGYLLRSLAAQGRQAVLRNFPDVAPEASVGPGGPEAPEASSPATRTELPHTTLRLGTPPYSGQVLLAFDSDRLASHARSWGVELELVPVTGDFIALEAPLFHVYGPADKVDRDTLVRCLLFGETPSAATDPAGALRALVDIALKALSPAINDPGRAVQALDHIEDLLVLLAPRLAATPPPTTGAFTCRTRSWTDYVCIGTDEIRHFGTTSLQVQRRLRALYATVALVCTPAQTPPLAARTATMDADLPTHWPQPLDRELARQADPQGLGTEQGSGVQGV
ncbi:DUF2254 domain-containing protein [Streptomyces sp. NPDC050418]|uniref:DUF2254 domain-containing protein n=1 Tax=Streptomyces sp. NPDC050418 TaxID=3365612 RepID=UPI0037A17355